MPGAQKWLLGRRFASLAAGLRPMAWLKHPAATEGRDYAWLGNRPSGLSPTWRVMG